MDGDHSISPEYPVRLLDSLKKSTPNDQTYDCQNKNPRNWVCPVKCPPYSVCFCNKKIGIFLVTVEKSTLCFSVFFNFFFCPFSFCHLNPTFYPLVYGWKCKSPSYIHTFLLSKTAPPSGYARYVLSSTVRGRSVEGA